MARQPKHTEPDDETELVTQDELDAANASVEPAAVEVTPMASTGQVDSHKQAVTIAVGTVQNSLAAATAARRAGGTSATYATAVKSADIAYYQSIVASAQTNGMPVGGAI